VAKEIILLQLILLPNGSWIFMLYVMERSYQWKPVLYISHFECNQDHTITKRVNITFEYYELIEDRNSGTGNITSMVTFFEYLNLFTSSGLMPR